MINIAPNTCLVYAFKYLALVDPREAWDLVLVSLPVTLPGTTRTIRSTGYRTSFSLRVASPLPLPLWCRKLRKKL